MTNDLLIPYRKNERWGYYSFIEKKVTIPCQFLNASTFKYIPELEEELAIVEDQNLFRKFQFFINKKGKQAIKLNHKYFWVSEFFNHDGSSYSKVARKKITGIKVGMINKSGIEIFNCEYDDCKIFTYSNDFYDRILPVKKNNKWGLVNDSNELVKQFQFDFIGDFNNDGVAICAIGAYNHLYFTRSHDLRYYPNQCYGFIDRKGNIINNGVRQFSEGLAAVQKPVTKKSEEYGMWGFINRYFEEAISFNYQNAHSFVNGLAAVKEYQEYGYGKWGFINKSGELVIGFKFDDVFSFSKVSIELDIYLAAIKINDKWGFIDKNGDLIIDCKFDEVYSFNNKISAVCINRKWGFINANGELIIDCKYDCIIEKKIKSNPFISHARKDIDFLVEGFLIKVSLNGREGFIDTNGTEYWED